MYNHIILRSLVGIVIHRIIHLHLLGDVERHVQFARQREMKLNHYNCYHLLELTVAKVADLRLSLPAVTTVVEHRMLACQTSFYEVCCIDFIRVGW